MAGTEGREDSAKGLIINHEEQMPKDGLTRSPDRNSSASKGESEKQRSTGGIAPGRDGQTPDRKR